VWKCGNETFPPAPYLKARGEKPFPFRGKGLGWGLRGVRGELPLLTKSLSPL